MFNKQVNFRNILITAVFLTFLGLTLQSCHSLKTKKQTSIKTWSTVPEANYAKVIKTVRTVSADTKTTTETACTPEEAEWVVLKDFFDDFQRDLQKAKEKQFCDFSPIQVLDIQPLERGWSFLKKQGFLVRIGNDDGTIEDIFLTRFKNKKDAMIFIVNDWMENEAQEKNCEWPANSLLDVTYSEDVYWVKWDNVFDMYGIYIRDEDPQEIYCPKNSGPVDRPPKKILCNEYDAVMFSLESALKWIHENIIRSQNTKFCNTQEKHQSKRKEWGAQNVSSWTEAVFKLMEWEGSQAKGDCKLIGAGKVELVNRGYRVKGHSFTGHSVDRFVKGYCPNDPSRFTVPIAVEK